MTRAFDHLGDDLRRLAGLSARAPSRISRSRATTSAGTSAFAICARLGERDVHREVLASLVAALVVDQHADLGAAVHVVRELALGLRCARSGGRSCSRRSSAPAPGAAPRPSRRRASSADSAATSAGLLRRDELGQRLREREEVLVLGDEVGLAVHLDQRADLAVGATVRADHAFGGDAPGRLARLGAALDAQQLLGLLQVAAGLGRAPSCIPSCRAR